MKRALGTVGAVIFLGLVGLAAWLRWSAFPPGSPAELPFGIRGIPSGGSCVWVIPSEDGDILIDAGGDRDAEAVVSDLSARNKSVEDVRAVLITNGYRGHWKGASKFPKAAVYTGPGERVLVTGERQVRTLLGTLSKLSATPEVPKSVAELEPGAVLTLGEHRIAVISAPGHTPGAAAYLVNEKILFTGDALLVRNNTLKPPPSLASEDSRLAEKSAAMLSGLQVGWVADGHCRVFHY